MSHKDQILCVDSALSGRERPIRVITLRRGPAHRRKRRQNKHETRARAGATAKATRWCDLHQSEV
jgi:hypothetical protein